MEAILAKLVSTYHLIEQISNWAVTNPGPAFFFGAAFWALLNTAVKLSPTRADDVVVDIIGKAFMAGWNKAFKR
jgi:hypothetical protein